MSTELHEAAGTIKEGFEQLANALIRLGLNGASADGMGAIELLSREHRDLAESVRAHAEAVDRLGASIIQAAEIVASGDV